MELRSPENSRVVELDEVEDAKKIEFLRSRGWVTVANAKKAKAAQTDTEEGTKTEDTWANAKKVELIEELQRRGVAVTGEEKKAELLELIAGSEPAE